MAGRSTHSQANPSLLYKPHSGSYPQPLTCVRVVWQNVPNLLRLPDIADRLDDYLDSSRKWTLPKACGSDSPYLVQRLLASQNAAAPTSFLHLPKYRQWQFDCSLIKAIYVGNLEIARLLAKHFEGCTVSGRVVEIAASCGRTEVLKWLVEWGCDIKWPVSAVSLAIANGFFEFANWLQEKLPTTSIDYMRHNMTEWAITATEKGNLDMVKQICGRFMERSANGNLRYSQQGVDLLGVVQCATDFGHLHVLQWMMGEPNRKVLLYELYGEVFDEETPPFNFDLSGAAAGGHIDVLTWLIQHFPGYCNSGNADFEAAALGYLDILRLLFSAPMERRTTPDAIDVAAGNGHLDVVKFLLAEGYLVNEAMDNAAENGFLDIVKWLHDNVSHSCSTRAMDDAASNGHLGVVKWLHENREEGCTASAMDGAAGQGHLEVVQWLHENRNEGCTTSAMDGAAFDGNLEMVKWLHLNRSEGCTPTAMDSAAGNGHLDVVKWLHSNRLESCTTGAMDLAAGYNHLEVLKWLDQNRTEGFTAEAMVQVARYGVLEVFQWLFSRRPELCMASLMSDAVACSRFNIVWFLYQNHRECGSVESLIKALINRPVGFAEWAYTHHRQEFERSIAEHLFADWL